MIIARIVLCCLLWLFGMIAAQVGVDKTEVFWFYFVVSVLCVVAIAFT